MTYFTYNNEPISTNIINSNYNYNNIRYKSGHTIFQICLLILNNNYLFIFNKDNKHNNTTISFNKDIFYFDAINTNRIIHNIWFIKHVYTFTFTSTNDIKFKIINNDKYERILIQDIPEIQLNTISCINKTNTIIPLLFIKEFHITNKDNNEGYMILSYKNQKTKKPKNQ